MASWLGWGANSWLRELSRITWWSTFLSLTSYTGTYSWQGGEAIEGILLHLRRVLGWRITYPEISVVGDGVIRDAPGY